MYRMPRGCRALQHPLPSGAGLSGCAPSRLMGIPRRARGPRRFCRGKLAFQREHPATPWPPPGGLAVAARSRVERGPLLLVLSDRCSLTPTKRLHCLSIITPAKVGRFNPAFGAAPRPRQLQSGPRHARHARPESAGLCVAPRGCGPPSAEVEPSRRPTCADPVSNRLAVRKGCTL